MFVHYSIQRLVIFLDGSGKIDRLLASQSWKKPGSAVGEWEPYLE